MVTGHSHAPRGPVEEEGSAGRWLAVQASGLSLALPLPSAATLATYLHSPLCPTYSMGMPIAASRGCCLG